MGILKKLFGRGEKRQEVSLTSQERNLRAQFTNLRDALTRYAASNGNYLPDENQIYDWKSLRRLIRQYGKQPLPSTEEESGFRFVRYRVQGSDYTLRVELLEPQDDHRQVEVTSRGIDFIR